MDKEKLLLAKERALKLVEQLRKVQKLVKKKTKNSEQLIKLAEGFIRCHVSNSVIYDKYEKFKKRLEELTGNSKELNECIEVNK